MVNDDDEVQSVISETDFENEYRLQREIQRQPDLIPGDQIDPEDSRRWLRSHSRYGTSFKSVERRPLIR